MAEDFAHMSNETNHLGQPVGAAVPDWKPLSPPSHVSSNTKRNQSIPCTCPPHEAPQRISNRPLTTPARLLREDGTCDTVSARLGSSRLALDVSEEA